MTAPALRNAAGFLAAFCLALTTAAPAAQAPVREASPAKPAALQVSPQPAQSTPTPAPAPAVPAQIFANIGDRPAVVYDAPSAKANKTYLFGRGYPVEVLVKLDKWTKLRDADGTLGWVETGALGTQRFVQVTAASAEVRALPSASATLVFEAAKGVLLEATGAAAEGWVPVKHRDGQGGYVATTQVFGP
jgi:SH3-like domain-containing protein